VIGICHCLDCQRRSGSSHSYQALFPRERVTVHGRSSKFTRRSDEDDQPRVHSFCPVCGSTVCYTTGEQPELISVTVGSFADPSFAAPRLSGWEERKHSWVIRPEGAEPIR